MAQQGETPIDPTAPAAPTGQELHTSATKRRRDGDDASVGEGGEGVRDLPLLKRQAAGTQDVLFRVVVPSREIGKVIGRQGSRIQKVREETRATIKIADAIARNEERVIIISSKDNGIMKSDAENALQQIAFLILKEDDNNLEALKVNAGQVVATNTIRLLIAGTQASSLIGMSGQNIENLRNLSGAMVTVLAQKQLPLCASAHESDRVVQISGDIFAVLKALEEIGCQLRENPCRQVLSISPTYNYTSIRPPQQFIHPTAADYVTLEMMISETMVGGLIGRSGSNIARIRNESGAVVKVYGGKGEQNHRRIHFGGSAPQVALAKQRVDEYVYSQLPQQSGVGAQLSVYNGGQFTF